MNEHGHQRKGYLSPDFSNLEKDLISGNKGDLSPNFFIVTTKNPNKLFNF